MSCPRESPSASAAPPFVAASSSRHPRLVGVGSFSSDIKLSASTRFSAGGNVLRLFFRSLLKLRTLAKKNKGATPVKVLRPLELIRKVLQAPGSIWRRNRR